MDEENPPPVDVSAPSSTRWDDPTLVASRPERVERSGNYLAVGVAIALPVLIVVTALRAAAGDTLSSLLPQRVELQQPPASTVVPAADGDRSPPDASEPGGTPASEPGPDAAPPTLSTDPVPRASSTVPTGPTTTPAPTTAVVDAAGVEPTAIVAEPDAATPTTRPPANTATTTTSTTSTTSTTTTVAPVGDGAVFEQRVDIGELGATFVRYRFTTEQTVDYSAVLLRGGIVEARTAGTATAGESVQARFDGLEPGTDYGVQVRLANGDNAASAVVPFRTSGDRAEVTSTAVELLDLRVVDVAATRIELHYESNICANGSFVITDSDGAVVGRNAGQTEGCTSRHLAIPGFWTAALQPNTTYTIRITVEADGQGRGNGNTATAATTVTTAS
jgi:hypothetical protein